jgi:hypothetical protein
MSKEYTPLVIAKSFTKQYYEIIHKKPQQLYRFYKDESNFFHGNENENTETISGGDNIREKVESLNLAGAKVDLTNGSIDAQRSDNNAVFLVVTGKFTMPGKSPRPFIQSFFLVCQNGGKSDAQPSYYVRNSVFRLFGDDDATNVTPPTPVSLVTTAVFEEKVDVVEPEKEKPAEEKVPEVTSEEDDSAKVEVPETTHEDVDSATVTSEPDYVNVSVKKEETVTSSSEETAPKKVKAVVPEPVVVKEKVKPASWAGLFDGAEPVQEAPKPKRVPVKKDVVTEKAPAGASAPLTVQLSQLPENVVESDVRPLFEPFGTIKKIDINAQRGVAYVDFMEASGVKNAMKKKGTDYFTIRDSSFQVEERHTRGAGNKSGNNNNRNNGKVGGGNSGGNRQNNNRNGDKKGDNRGGNNNNRNRTGNKTTKPSTASSGQK